MEKRGAVLLLLLLLPLPALLLDDDEDELEVEEEEGGEGERVERGTEAAAPPFEAAPPTFPSTVAAAAETPVEPYD